MALNYYYVARLSLLATILVLGLHCISILYLRSFLGREERADQVPFHLCALAQAVACGQLLLVVLVGLGGSVEESLLLGGAAHALQAAAATSFFALTPFAYLFHEAVGVGQVWGAAGFAGRAAEAAVLLGLLAILARGTISVLASLLVIEDGPSAAASSAATPSITYSAHTLLQAALVHTGLALLLVTVPRGALLLVPRRGSKPSSQPPSPRAIAYSTRQTRHHNQQHGSNGQARSLERGANPPPANLSLPVPAASDVLAPAGEPPPRGHRRRNSGERSDPAAERSPPPSPQRSDHGYTHVVSASHSPGSGGYPRIRRGNGFELGAWAASSPGNNSESLSSPGTLSDDGVSLLAQPLPTRRSATLAALRTSPQRAMQLIAATLWVWLLCAATIQLLSHMADSLRAPPPPPPPPPPPAASWLWWWWPMGWESELETAPFATPSTGLSSGAGVGLTGGGAPLEPPLGSDGSSSTAAAASPADASSTPAGTASWLVLHLILAAASGHHLACRHTLTDTARRRTPSLHSALLQTAALQLQAAALPVGAHALGLMPTALASSVTTLPLITSPLHAAAFCACFLGANAVGFLAFVARAPRAGKEVPREAGSPQSPTEFSP